MTKKAKKAKRIKRPPRIFVDNKGRYIKFKGKRVYLESGLTNNQLVRVIINNFQKSRNKQKKRQKRNAPPSAQGMSDPTLEKIAKYLPYNRADVDRGKISEIEKDLVRQT